VDRLTAALSAVPEAEQCGWVKDSSACPGRSSRAHARAAGRSRRREGPRAMEAMMTMKRIDIAAVERAAEGRRAS
jgi:predicted 3-demethylubiquinone-9 3-methyltransferase (glyoxalase superfamily)